MKKYFSQLLIICLSCCNLNSFATHIRGGSIKVDRVESPTLLYKITVFKYLNTQSVSTGGGELNLGDGVIVDLSNDNNLVSQEPLNDNISVEIHEVFHNFVAPGLYLISFRESNRTGGSLNIPNTSEIPFYTESLLLVDPFLGFNRQPVFSLPPIDIVTSGKAFIHNLGAYDLDGDSLSYEIVTPKQGLDQNISGYLSPDDIQFYSGRDYDNANEAMNAPPSFGMDAVTGDLVWDAPGSAGLYNMAIKVLEWRKVAGRWVRIGFRILDIQVTVEENENERPDFTVPSDICVAANTLLEKSLIATDPDGHDVLFKTTGEAYNLAGNSAGFVTGSGSTAGNSFLDVNWQPRCEAARNRPYTFYFKSVDVPPSTPNAGLAVVKTWNVTVAGAPEGLHGQVKEVGEITLNWNDYFCDAAESISIYRIRNSFSFPQDNCQPGVPENSGFELIANVNPDDNSFLDDNDGAGLDPNTTYCYRIVAVFNESIGGESVASAEFCTRPDEGSLVTGIGDQHFPDNLESSINIYPSPAHNHINIRFPRDGFKPLALGISDLQGKVYHEQRLLSPKDQYQLSVQGIAPGMYLVWVRSATQLLTRKVVIN